MTKFLILLCFVLLLTSVVSRHKEQHRPCTFNPLCTCSNGGPDLGSVCCHGIPFLTIPQQINNSAIYMMSFKQNNMRFLEDHCLNGTGLWKLQINDNVLTDLPTNAFAGLERTLSILDVRDNNLVRIPKDAIQSLEKLSNLNLAGNQITFLHNDDFRNVGKTLKYLDLSKNSIMHIQTDAFRNMMSLEVLNLAYNAIMIIDDITFQTGLHNLKHIILTGNQLQQIPLNALGTLRNIKIINLNENLISTISEGREVRNRIYLEELHLEYNLIKELTPESFRLFHQVNRIFLKGNPISILNDTFLNTNVSEVYLQHCGISLITKNSFFSATNSLQVLDLSYNNLLELPTFPLTKLSTLILAGNEIGEIVPENINYYGSSLKYLDLRGSKMNGLTQEAMKHLPNIRELLINKKHPVLKSQYLSNLGPSVEKLYIVKSFVKEIEINVFQHLSGIKHLDLSHNRITKIGNTTFKDVRHSLEKLVMHKSIKMTVFPYKVLNNLQKLSYLDISNNNLVFLPPDSFTSLQNLKYLNMNHNNIKEIIPHLLNDLNNPNLEYLKISFNKITNINSYSFRNLLNLVHLQLNDNLICEIRRGAFYDLDSILTIQLEGNTIQSIENEAFQNLPNIQFINLGYNKLHSFNLKAFNQVGRLSFLHIKVDNNNIQNLTANYAGSHASSNIKSLDFSYNNISFIDSNYFSLIKLSITLIDLSNNAIANLTNNAFSNLAHLQTLILTNNFISIIGENELKDLKAIQILKLSGNNIKAFPNKMFDEQIKLRILLASHNNLEDLSSMIFTKTVIEQLDLSYNSFTVFPEIAINGIKNSLQYLDLAGNQISFMNFSNIKLLTNLRHLSVSKNKLLMSNTDVEFHFSKLIYLDLASNNFQEVSKLIVENIPESLEILNMANTSMTEIPAFHTSNILFLNFSSNFIDTVKPEALEKLKKLQLIDLSNNLLSTTFNHIWSNLQQLKSLYLQNNPIQILTNNSFSHMERLQELFIKNLDLQEFDTNALQQLSTLRKIEMDYYPNLDITQLLSKNFGIQEVHLHIDGNILTGNQNDNFPKSIKLISIEGENLKHIDEHIFGAIYGQNLKLIIKNSNITKISHNLFKNLKEVKNLTVSFIHNKLQTVERLRESSESKDTQQILWHVNLSGNPLKCSCDFAWLWDWIREYEYNICNEICESTYLKDLRESKCLNMNNQSLINVFKSELKCFTNNAFSLKPITLYTFFISISYILYLYIFSIVEYNNF